MVSSNKDQGKNKVTSIKTFNVPFDLGEIKENITIATKTPSNPYKQQIINQALKFHSQGNISEAAKYYQYCINQGFKDHRIFSNYGTILKGLGKSKEAELSLRKAIEIKPDFADAHYNLGNTLKSLGDIKEAESSLRKAIELNPEFAGAHLNLGNILIDLGNLKEAELSLRKAISLNKSLDQAISALGSVLMRQGKHKEGLQKLREGNGCVKFDYRSSSKTINFLK